MGRILMSLYEYLKSPEVSEAVLVRVTIREEEDYGLATFKRNNGPYIVLYDSSTNTWE